MVEDDSERKFKIFVWHGDLSDQNHRPPKEIDSEKWAEFFCAKKYFNPLDLGGRVDSTVLKNLKDLDITNLTCGRECTAVITEDGFMYTWGEGPDGQLGHGSTFSCPIPKLVLADLASQHITQVALGVHHIAAISSTGRVYTWGDNTLTGHGGENNTFLQYTPKLLEELRTEHVTTVSANKDHTACTTNHGDVFTWGKGKYGKLGHGSEITLSTPKRVDALSNVNAKQVACGLSHTLVSTDDGEVYSFGHGICGQLGHGDREHKLSPALIRALEGKHITQIQCGFTHSMALTSRGCVFKWGRALNNDRSQQKTVSIPYLVKELRSFNVVQIGSYNYHSAAVVDSAPVGNDYRRYMRSLLNNGQASDVTFLVGKHHIHAKIEILVGRSEYFKAMFRSNTKESVEKEIPVQNCSKQTFLLLLEYLYCDDFAPSIDHAVELFHAADMYQLEGLKLLCQGTLERELCDMNIVETLVKADNFTNGDDLKVICIEYFLRPNTYEHITRINDSGTLTGDLLFEIKQKWKEAQIRE